MTEPKNRLTPSTVVKALRAGMLTRAAVLVGHARLADALGIRERSFRAKIAADRGVSNVDLRLAATALETRASAALAQAKAIRAHLTDLDSSGASDGR